MGSQTIPPPPSGSTVMIPPPPSGSIVHLGQSPAAPSLTDNPRGEGTYQLSKGNATIGVPYSNVDQALNSGYGFANIGEDERFRKDRAYDPNPNRPSSPFVGDGGAADHPALSLGTGVAKGAMQTVGGVGHILHIPGSSRMEQLADTPSSDALESAGVGMEGIAEFLLGDEALKGLSLSDKLAKVIPSIKAIEKSPLLAKIVSTAIRTGTVAGAQTEAKTGGDTSAAGLSALVGAGTAGGGELLTGGAEAGIDALRNRATLPENLAGTTVDVPGDVRNAKPTKLQSQSADVVRGAARNAAKQPLEELNAARPTQADIDRAASTPQLPMPGVEVPTEVQQLLPTEGPAGPPTRTVTGGPTKIPTPPRAAELPEHYSYERVPFEAPTIGESPASVLTGQNAATMRVRTPEQARNMLSSLEGIDLQNVDAATRGKVEQTIADLKTLGATGESGPIRTLPAGRRIDVPNTLRSIGSFHDTAQQLLDNGVETYTRANAASEDEFSQLNGEVKGAQKKLWEARTKGGDIREARTNLNDALQRREDLMTRLRNNVPKAEADAARASIKKSYLVDSIGDALDSSLTGAKGGFFDGGKFARNWSKVKRTFGEGPLRETLGDDHFDALDRLSHVHNAPVGALTKWLKSTKVERYLPAAAGIALAHSVGLPWELGAAGGAGADMAAKKIVEHLLTNPQALDNIHFALQSGANPKNYIPMVGTQLINAAAQQAQQEEQQNANQ